MTTTKVPVSLRSLTRRINRKLPAEETLKRPRGTQGIAELGGYYLLNIRLNRVVQRHVDPIVLATDLGVLKAWEVVVEEPQHDDE